MGNIASIIPSHNRNVLYLIVAVENGCSCRPRNECPLQNKCLTSKIFYRSYVQNDTKKMMKKNYNLGCLKHHLRNVLETTKKEFSYSKHKCSTKIAMCVWHLKDLKIIARIS